MSGSGRCEALAICIGIAIAGCSHQGSGAAASSAATDGQAESIGGVWSGADTSGRGFLGLADEAGEFQLIGEDGTQYVGTASTLGAAVSASAERLVRHGAAGGPKYDAASLKGKVQQRVSLSVTIAPAAAARAFTPETISLQFNPIYNNPSSLAMFAGDYVDPSSGDMITVSGSGSIFWRDPNTGCLGSGAVSEINDRYDLYEVQFSYSACQGADADLNGMEFTGLGTLDTTVQPVQAIIGVSAEAGGRGYAIDMRLSRLPPRSPV
jgi:hypothetical protein